MSTKPFASGLGAVTAADIEEILVSRTGLAAEAVSGQLYTALVDLGLDSLAALELQAEAARRFGVQIPEGAIEMSIAGLVAHINENLEVAKSA
jgi:minimal PKS acyl carrier protein